MKITIISPSLSNNLKYSQEGWERAWEKNLKIVTIEQKWNQIIAQRSNSMKKLSLIILL